MSIVTVDFDGTLYQHNSVMAMLKAGKTAFTLKQWFFIVMNFLNGSVNRTRGNKVDLHVVLLKSFFYQMKGKNMDEMHAFFESIANTGRQSINYDLVSRITKHLENGDRVIILSGALQPFLEVFIRQLDIRADAIGTSLLYDERGICTGEISRLNHGVDKVNKLKLWIKENDASGESIWAYADSESDIPLLEFADKAVVVQPSNAMKKIAESKGWEIFYN
jgi:HAD superfamily phosphoserine phosphatase-like hydrolase